ncbi:hypothetical protein GOP47_0030403, partial [Adiantum capillus-veneris]
SSPYGAAGSAVSTGVSAAGLSLSSRLSLLHGLLRFQAVRMIGSSTTYYIHHSGGNGFSRRQFCSHEEMRTQVCDMGLINFESKAFYGENPNTNGKLLAVILLHHKPC